MNKNKLHIVHYYPLEFFPPITNLLDYLSNELNEYEIIIYTTHNNLQRKPYNNNKIKIVRYPFPYKTDGKLIKLYKYIIFFISTLFKIIIDKPDKLLYYESISSWPAYVYKKYINPKCKIFIHYHEYASQDWYNKYMKLVSNFHKHEKSFLYTYATWISQTNHHRLRLFHKDNQNIKSNILKIMPNYPPKSWGNENTRTKKSYNRIVYIGSLSFESTYIKEFCYWILNQEYFIFEIYAYNLHNDVKEYLNKVQNSKITFHNGGIEYDEIPLKLKEFDIGIILHKAFNENYKYNATNKLFEYLAIGLDVWFPDELIGCQDYVSINSFPKVIPVDFKKLNTFNWKKAINRIGLRQNKETFYCEDVYKELVEELANERTTN